MKHTDTIRAIKEASACIKKFEAESATLKEKVAKSTAEVAKLNKEAEALKIAMELTLDDQTLSEVMDKFASIKEKDLNVVKEAMDLDLSKKTANIGALKEDDSRTSTIDPVKAFLNVLASK